MSRFVAGFCFLFVALMAVVNPASADELQVKVTSITSPVTPRQPIKLVVQTEQGATCGGSVHWQFKQTMSDFSLRQKSANNDGVVDWSWNAPSAGGRGLIEITCTAGDKSGKASASVSVQ
jgi:hypothetical protein